MAADASSDFRATRTCVVGVRILESETGAITMTTLAAILALLPLALDLSHSAGMPQPLAIAIIAASPSNFRWSCCCSPCYSPRPALAR